MLTIINFHGSFSFEFSSKFFTKHSNFQSTCPEEYFEENYFSLNFFSVIFGLRAPKFFGVLTESFQQGFQNCILRVQRNVLRKSSFRDFLKKSISDFQRNKFGPFAEKFGRVFSKLHSTCLEEEFGKNKIMKKFRMFFLDFQRNLSGVWGRFSGRIVETEFHVPR